MRFESGKDCITADETICRLASGVPAAFSQAAASLFSISAPPADLDLSVRVIGIDPIPTVGGSQLVMRVRVTLSAADRPLGSIEVAGEGPFQEYAAPRLEAAAARATQRVAEEFIAAFPEGSPQLVE
ncbi:MAG TPA: hypothetical protein VE964_08385 [Myxococcales bacterium]|nr:hypothetical protein [Myxococcales bacterium]